MVYSKLKAWKEESNLTYKDIGERSNTPAATVQKIFNGDTQNPNSETVYNIVKALGHTMEELYDGQTIKESKEEIASVAVIREMYESRIAELKEQHQQHVAYVKDNAESRVKAYKIAIGILSVFMAILFVLFLAYFMIDYSTEHWGIFFSSR